MRCEPERWEKYQISNPEWLVGGGGTSGPLGEEPDEQNPPPPV